MIRFKTKIGDLDIPQSYADLSIDDIDYLHKNSNNLLEVFRRITGWNDVQLAMIELDSITPHLEFLQTPILDSVEPINIIKVGASVYTLPEDVGECQWAQKLLATNAVKEKNILGVLAVYLQPIIDGTEFNTNRTDEVQELFKDLDVDAVYSCVKFLVDQMTEIAAIENKTLKPEITFEQKQAGISMFNALGDFNTIDMIAGGDVLKYEDVLKIEYNTIYNKLLKIKLNAKFDKRYSEIMQKRK